MWTSSIWSYQSNSNSLYNKDNISYIKGICIVYFLQDLDSFLNHLKLSTDEGALVFVEAALMIQNFILIYQKRVDQLIDVMMKLIGKFRA